MPCPASSLAAEAGRPGLLVLRSFGKFYGLAGLRLGFVLGSEADVAALDRDGGTLADLGRGDRDRTARVARSRLGRCDERTPGDATRCGSTVWRRAPAGSLLGGTPLFRLYETGDAAAAQERLARAKIWSRIFTDKPDWLRLGLPGDETEWTRLSEALSAR